MELALVPDSTLIGAQGYAPEASLLFLCFKDKGEVKPDVYEFQNIAPETYEEMMGAKSVGGYFSQQIKPFREKYPYRRLAPEEARDLFVNGRWPEPATDFTANGTPVPATTAPAEIELADDPEALKAQALELSERTKTIAIVSPEAYSLAATTLLAIARMRISLETTFRPGIQEKHQAWKAELAVLNHYDGPLEQDEMRLKQGMSEFKRKEDADRRKAEEAERLRLQAEAEEDAKKRSVDLQIADAIAAEQRGEPDIAKMILDAPPLPMAPVYTAPVSYRSTVPKTAGITHVEEWTYEIEKPELLPRQWLIPDETGLAKHARNLKGRAEVPGVRFFDAGGVRASAKPRGKR